MYPHLCYAAGWAQSINLGVNQLFIITPERRAWENSRANKIIMESSYIKCQVNDMDKRVLWVFRGRQDLCSSKLVLLLPSHLSK